MKSYLQMVEIEINHNIPEMSVLTDGKNFYLELVVMIKKNSSSWILKNGNTIK